METTSWGLGFRAKDLELGVRVQGQSRVHGFEGNP